MTHTKQHENISKIPIKELADLRPEDLSKIPNEIIKQYTSEEFKDIYEYGWGNRYEKNFPQAAALYRIASLGGNREAQNQYAEMLFEDSM